MSGAVGVLVSGSGSNLQALIDARLPIVLVISNRPGVRALERAEAAGIPTLVVDHKHYADRNGFDRALVAALRGSGVTLVVLAGFMRIVGAAMLEAFPRRIVNIHPALLPCFPGVNAQAQALDAGVRISGCTVHLVDAGVDTGPILAQAAVPVLPDDDEHALSRRILAMEHRILPAVVQAIIEGRLVEDPRGRPRIDGPLDVIDPIADVLISPRPR